MFWGEHTGLLDRSSHEVPRSHNSFVLKVTSDNTLFAAKAHFTPVVTRYRIVSCITTKMVYNESDFTFPMYCIQMGMRSPLSFICH